MSKISRKIAVLSIISSIVLGIGVQTSATTLDEMYKQAFDYTIAVTNKADKHKVKAYYSPQNGGATDTQYVVDAVKDGMQLDIFEARAKINNLPDNLLQSKRTLSSILDNYQHPIYERIVSVIEQAKKNPNQQDLNSVRYLIKDVPSNFRSCYSSAVDEVQIKMFNTAGDLVNKAIITKTKEDIITATNYINQLKTDEFMTSSIQHYIDSLFANLDIISQLK